MANNLLNVSNLTLNPKEKTAFSEFIMEEAVKQLTLDGLITMYQGVTMKEQIVYAGHFGKVGIADTSCTAPSSDAEMSLTQKYWEPETIGDRFSICQKEINGLFKAYFDKISNYSQLFNIEPSDEEKVLMQRLIEAVGQAIVRYIWFGDKSAAEANTTTAGLKLADDVKFYDTLNGLWMRIFTGVSANDIEYVKIDENDEITTADQLTFASGAAIAYFKKVWAKADTRLKSAANKKLYVSGAIYENYLEYLEGLNNTTSLAYLENGKPALTWRGIPVINMQNEWDLLLFADFVDNTVNNAYDKPNRIILSTPENLMAATLNENDFKTLNGWYENKDRKYFIDWGATLDTNYGLGYMIVTAY